VQRLRSSVTALMMLVAALIPGAATATDQARPATIHGRLVLESTKIPAPKSARLRLGAVGETKDVEVACAVEENRLACDAPAGRFDAALHAPGFAPVHFWGITTTSAELLNLGPIELRTGGAIAGKVLDRGAGLDGVEVELVPSATPAEGNAVRAAILTRRAVTDREGKFSFADVGTGTYSVVARLEGYSAANVRPVRVEAPAEVRLDAIELAPLRKLEVFVTPPVDPQGARWVCTLHRAVPLSGYHEVVRRGMVSEAGHWSADLLDASTYRLQIATAAGDPIETREVELSDNAILNIGLSRLPIRGLITLGDRPIAASIVLQSEDSARVTFRSNGEGIFTGFLPEKETWRARVQAGKPRIELQVDDVEISRDGDTAFVHIELPAGAVAGTVVDENGRPVVATVMLTGERGVEASTESDAEGKFTLHGLTTGARRIKAGTLSGESDLLPVDVTDDEEPQPLTLVVRSQTIVRGDVVDAAGNGIPGAVVRYRGVGGETRTTTTGLAGEFSFPVIKGAPVTSLAVLADGWPKTLLTVADPSRRQRVVLGGAPARLMLQLRGAPPWPFVTADRAHFFWLPDLFLPRPAGPPAEFRDGRFALDLLPGTYTVCPEPVVSDRCATRSLAANTSATLMAAPDQRWR
jgi:Carboxypeptidase regulatory-like domain